MDKVLKIKEIQREYYAILDEFYGDFYNNYKKSGKNCNEYVLQYLRSRKSIILNNKEDNHSLRHLEFTRAIRSFWSSKIKYLREGLSEYENMGMFGTAEKNDAIFYEETIKQNCIFFNMVALNDPFYDKEEVAREIRMYSGNIMLFYRSIVAIYDIQEYILDTEEMFAIIVPAEALITLEEKEKIIDNCHSNAISFIKENFGIDHDEKNAQKNLARNIAILKELSDEDISKKLIDNDILLNLKEAQKYEMAMLNMQDIIFDTINLFGYLNTDFIRCLVNYSAILHIVEDVLLVYNLHCKEAKGYNMHPIFNIYEWFPNKFYYSGMPEIQPSTEYKYVCAIQRNDSIAQIVQMNVNELRNFRANRECDKFRQLFNQATNSIMNTPDQFDEIAQMVFIRLNELLQKESSKKKTSLAKKRGNAIIGLAKSIAGFVPILSQFIGVYDTMASSYDVFKVYKKEDDIVEHLLNHKNNIIK